MGKTLIKKLLNKNIQYNILSLINVFIGFLFIVILGRKFGAGHETDIYFFSMIMIVYLGHIAHIIWEAMSPYYIELKIKDKMKSDDLYITLLNNLILISLIIILLYFLVTNNFTIISSDNKAFLDIFIFYLVFQNIILINKTILNLEHYYASTYIVDIFIYLILLITISFISVNEFYFLAIGMVIASVIASIWQFYLIFIKLNIKYKFLLYNKEYKEIYKNSFKLKIGSLLYGSKDIFIASVFTSFGSGTFSLYSYANKFAGVVLQVINAPIVNIFATKANYHIRNKTLLLLQKGIKKVLVQTISLFTIASAITYFILPFIISILFGDKFTKIDINTIQYIFLIMSFFYLLLVIKSPYGRLIALYKQFNFSIIVNIVFFILLTLDFILFKVLGFGYNIFLFLLIFIQFVQVLYIYIFINPYIKGLK